jgi:NADH-quinone oxidoreductase subunit N
LIPLAEITAPDIDYAGLSPLLALTGGASITLLVGLFRGPSVRAFVAGAALATLGATALLSAWQLGENKSIVEGALRTDDLAMLLDILFCVAGAATVLLSLRDTPARPGREGDYYVLLLSSVLGMAVLAGSQNLITLFLGFELLSIPLYVMCAGAVWTRRSLEAGLKYLVVGSVGSATLLYGLALVYGATSSTDFGRIAAEIGGGGVLGDPLLFMGIALSLTGLAFKASVAPFHQWTPDVYQGAPTPVTAFMAVATKAAAFAILLRFFDQALLPAEEDWDLAVAVLAAISIVVGNIGAIGQDSLKRMLAWSGIAQAGYMLAGVAVASELGAKSVVFYLLVYLLMNMAAFAVVIARERETGLGDDISAVAGIGAERPLLAWPLTISMLALAGFPGTAGFVGKFFLIEAAVEGDFTWLGVAIVIGTMISLVYYLRVIAAVWMRGTSPDTVGIADAAAAPAIAGGAPEADPREPDPPPPAARASATAPGAPSTTARSPIGAPEVVAVALVMAAASIVFGIVPSPLLDLAADVHGALPDLR